MYSKFATVLSIVTAFYFVYDVASNYGVFAEAVVLLLASFLIQEVISNKPKLAY